MLPILIDITIAATGVPQQLPDVPFQAEVWLSVNNLTGASVEVSANSDFTQDTVFVPYQIPFVYTVSNGGNLNQLWIQRTAGDVLSVLGV